MTLRRTWAWIKWAVSTQVGIATSCLTLALWGWVYGAQLVAYFTPPPPPPPRPAKLLEYRLLPEWRNGSLRLSLQYRIEKTRNCNYTSDRFIEYKVGNELRSFRINGARGSSVSVGDTRWHQQVFDEVRDVLQPGMEATLIVRGYYQCPEGDNQLADPVIAKFTVPPLPDSRAR